MVDKAQLGLEHESWSNLLNDKIVGELAVPFFEANLLEARRTLRVKDSDEKDEVLLQHGVQQGRATSYLVDFDFYTNEKTNVRDAKPILDKFNGRAGRAFRWCIKPVLHGALRPQPLD